MTCPICGKKSTHSIEQYRYRESGLDNVFVSGVGMFRCKCGEEYVQLPGVDNIHNQIAAALLHKPSLLTGPEAKFLRKWLRLTSEELAKALGYTRVSVSRWENKGFAAATDRALRLYASQVGNVSVDVGDLFSTINDKPEKNFRIEVDGALPLRQSSVDVSRNALAITSAAEGLEPMPFVDFMKPCVMSLELAGISTVLLSSVNVFGTGTVVHSTKSYIDMLTNFNTAFAMPDKSAKVTGKEPDSAANQELAQAA